MITHIVWWPSNSVSFEKRIVETLATWTVFVGYFNVRDRFEWEFIFFMYEILLCVIGFWNNKKTLLLQNTQKSLKFSNVFIIVIVMHYQ